ncbi:MAG: hypothetical protein NWE86_02605 [Candidatus Bathyarchaeota archaeon]|nr:hypothetical protein [Candidatus Bathyarchaeota archaeon]
MKRKLIKPKCPKCGNKMQPYNAVLPEGYICLVCVYTTKINKSTTKSFNFRERYCPEE